LSYANKAWYSQADLPHNAPGMTVENWMPFVTDESLASFAHYWRMLMEDRQPVTFECQFKAQWKSRDPTSGESIEGPRWFLISAWPEFDEDGSLKSAWGKNSLKFSVNACCSGLTHF
jgi:hypothetical protein